MDVWLEGVLCSDLLHPGVAAGQLLPQIGDVVVVLLQVLLEVVAPEGQHGLLHLAVELEEQSSHIPMLSRRSYQSYQSYPFRKICLL